MYPHSISRKEFPYEGAMPDALQDVNTKIFTEWLPALKVLYENVGALQAFIFWPKIKKMLECTLNHEL